MTPEEREKLQIKGDVSWIKDKIRDLDTSMTKIIGFLEGDTFHESYIKQTNNKLKEHEKKETATVRG